MIEDRANGISTVTIREAEAGELFDYADAMRRERRDNRAGAKAFATACARGDVEAFWEAVDFLNDWTVDGWRLAMKQLARMSAVTAEIQQAFLNLWIESKMLPLRVGDRRVMADALRILMPGNYHGAPMRLFRGAGGREHRHRLYGFSWTAQRQIAERFAQHWGRNPVWGGVVLSTHAPAGAILVVRDDEEYFDESEVVVDPFRIGKVTLEKRLAPPTSTTSTQTLETIEAVSTTYT
jgi:hypothetical protein